MNRRVSDEIVALLHDGDHNAFEKIFFAYFNKVKYFIHGLIKSEGDAEEIAQDIFMKLWVTREAIDPEKNFNTYLYTCARNAALNFLRKKYVRDSYAQEYLHIGVETENPEENLFAKEIDLLIGMSVVKMPQRRRVIYEMSRNEGLSNSEIAEKLQVSKKTVENQLSLALNELRDVIGLFLLFFMD